MIPNLPRMRIGLLLAAAVCWGVGGALTLGLLPMMPGAAQAQGTAPTPAAADDTADTAAGAQSGDAAQAAEDTGDGGQTDDAAQAAEDTGAQSGDAAQAAADAGDGGLTDDAAQAADDTAAPPAAVSTSPTTGATPATSQDAAAGSSLSGGGSSDSGAATPAGGAAMSAMGGEIDWGRDFRAWERTTGYVNSAAHGNRLLVTYVTPTEAAKVYRGNAALVRNGRQSGFQRFPPGTQIVAESFRKGPQGKPGPRGPLFFMQKDATGGGWRYALTDADFRLIGEGTSGRVAFCQACHETAAARDAVYAVDR